MVKPIWIKDPGDLGIARETMRILASKGPRVMAVGDVIWRYDSMGVWRPVHRDVLTKTIAMFDGAMYKAKSTSSPKKTEVKNLRISATKLESIRRIVPDLATRLPEPEPGVATQNRFIATSEDGTIVARAHDPGHFATDRTNIRFDSNATCPGWVEMLRRVWDGCSDVNDRINALAQFFGLALLGYGTRYCKAMVLVGSGANGKSTLLGILRRLFDRSAVTAVPPQSWVREYDRARMFRAKLNVCSELPGRAMTDTDLFKAIVDGEEVSARHPYGQVFEYRPTASHVWAANALPETHDQSDGFWRRFIVLDFPNRFDGSTTKEDLVDDVVAELPGILTWAIRGAVDALQANAILIPPSAHTSKNLWQCDSDQAARFVVDCCEVLESPIDLDVARIYGAFVEWAKATGYQQPMSQHTLSRRLGERGLRVRVKAQGPLRDKTVLRIALKPRRQWNCLLPDVALPSAVWHRGIPAVPGQAS